MNRSGDDDTATRDPAATQPDLAAPAGGPQDRAEPGPRGAENRRGRVPRTRAGGLWVAIGGFGVVLLFLLIFILQNLHVTSVHFLGARWRLPVGVALLLATVAGVLLAGMAGTARIIQLRLLARRGSTSGPPGPGPVRPESPAPVRPGSAAGERSDGVAPSDHPPR